MPEGGGAPALAPVLVGKAGQDPLDLLGLPRQAEGFQEPPERRLEGEPCTATAITLAQAGAAAAAAAGCVRLSMAGLTQHRLAEGHRQACAACHRRVYAVRHKASCSRVQAAVRACEVKGVCEQLQEVPAAVAVLADEVADDLEAEVVRGAQEADHCLQVMFLRMRVT